MLTSRRICAVVLGIFCALAPVADASSNHQGRISYLTAVDEPRINTPSGRAHAHSSFDLLFTLHDKTQDVKLTLEPNDDLIPDGAKVEYLNEKGEVERTELLVRSENKVFKGRSWLRDDKGWYMVGWARIMVVRDGRDPLFKGAFSINHDAHHIDFRKTIRKDHRKLDPSVDLSGDSAMIVFRDSDMSSGLVLQTRDVDVNSTMCPSDRLSFNNHPENAINKMILEPRTSGTWGGIDLFGDVPFLGRRGITKRQTSLDDDSAYGGFGNSAGVNLQNTIGSTKGCPTTRRVALIGLATDCTYTGAFDSDDEARENIIDLVNTASDLYERTFNITLGLSQLSITPRECPATAPSSAKWNLPCEDSSGKVQATIDSRLSMFSQWRGEGARKDDGLALWTLMTTCETGSSVGLAWLGQLCKSSVTTNSDDGSFVSGANIVAKTPMEWKVLAHEIGHTMGAVHDCTPDTCTGTTMQASMCCPLNKGTCSAGGGFIMNPSTSDKIQAFSACTIGNICSAFDRNSVDSSCLRSNRDVQILTEKECGNGIVEEGEDCDCGDAESCAGDSCCNPETCKFADNAVCDDSNDNCCIGCQFAAADTVCRAGSGECDPEEKCTGKDASCPTNIVADDGTSCGNDLQCASGQCTSRDQQCRTLFDGTNSTSSCDESSCTLSCLSESLFGTTCTIMRQNFLDGTPCKGDGKCDNGQCTGATTLGGIKAWIDKHKPIVIGVASGIGALLLLCILCCCCSRCKRGRGKPRHRTAHSAHTRWQPIDGNGPPQQQYQTPPQYNQWQPQSYGNAPPYPSPPQRVQSTRYA